MKTIFLERHLMMLLVTGWFIILSGCGGGGEPSGTKDEPANPSSDQPSEINKGIGPVTEVKMGELDQAMAAEGKEIFDKMCTACHKPKEKFIGPPLQGILDRRSPEWIMNMILNPEEMVREDPDARQLLMEYNLAPMADQGLTREQARKILEYFRTIE